MYRFEGYILIILFVLIVQKGEAQTQWSKSPQNLILTKANNFYEGTAIGSPSIIDEGDTLKMVYAAGGLDSKGRISYAYSIDGVTWIKYNRATPVLDVSPAGNWDSHFLDTPEWIKDALGYKLYYFGDADNDPIGSAIGLATSNDGIHWQRYGTQPVLKPGNPGDWDELYIESPSVLFDGQMYYLWYSGVDSTYRVRIGVAISKDGVTWTKFTSNPVIDVGTINSWEGFSVATPTVIKRRGIFEMWYCGASYYDLIDNNAIDTIRIGYATSSDGLHWTKYAYNPVMSTYDDPYTVFESRGPWAPDVIYRPLENKYYMWYETAYGFGLATAPDDLLTIKEKQWAPFRFTLSPNPVTDILRIRFSAVENPQGKIQLFNILGKQIGEYAISQTMQIDTSILPPGIYFLVLKGRSTQIQKFIKLQP